MYWHKRSCHKKGRERFGNCLDNTDCRKCLKGLSYQQNNPETMSNCRGLYRHRDKKKTVKEYVLSRSFFFRVISIIKHSIEKCIQQKMIQTQWKSIRNKNQEKFSHTVSFELTTSALQVKRKIFEIEMRFFASKCKKVAKI